MLARPSERSEEGVATSEQLLGVDASEELLGWGWQSEAWTNAFRRGRSGSWEMKAAAVGRRWSTCRACDNSHGGRVLALSDACTLVLRWAPICLASLAR